MNSGVGSSKPLRAEQGGSAQDREGEEEGRAGRLNGKGLRPEPRSWSPGAETPALCQA